MPCAGGGWSASVSPWGLDRRGRSGSRGHDGRPGEGRRHARRPSNLPEQSAGHLADLKPNEPLEITYPDADSPGVLIKLGAKVPTGAGPDGDVVGFSTLCPHKGFPLRYTADEKAFDCPGHYSRFDAENGGMQIWGQATQNLAQFELTVDDKGDIYASGVDELIYGRLSNVL